MTHDVFISYSSKDKPIADAICNSLEGAGVRCWIAPRDIAPGEIWPKAITRAISQSRAMVLVFSTSSNSSEDVSREIILAANSKLVIIPFKIENIEPEPDKQYYLANTHWLDAMNPPTKEQIDFLVKRVVSFIPATRKEESKSGISGSEPQAVIAPIKAPPLTRNRSRWRPMWISGVFIVLLSLAIWFFAGGIFRKLQVAETKPTLIPALDFTAKTNGLGATLFAGPGENYPVLAPVLADVKIVGQASGCVWLKVITSTDSKYGWIKADQLTFSAACADIPAAEIPPVPTAVVLPTAKPKPTSTSTPIILAPLKLTNLLIRDDLSSNRNGWPTWNYAKDGCSDNGLSFQNNGLVWQISAIDNYSCSYFMYPGFTNVSDFDVSIDIERSSGSGKSDAGLAFRVLDGDNYYIFTVDDANQNFDVRINQKPRGISTLIFSTYVQEIQPKAANRLAISARGSQFTFSINNKVVAKLTDTNFSSGSIGLIADVYDGGSITAKNSNFELYTR
jgi:hypothetical protein